MQVIARRTLKEFWARHPRAEGPIRAWFAVVAKARWANPADIKRQFGGTVDFVGDNRVIFDLGGHKYRLVAHISFAFGRVLVKFIGTHAEYDRMDPGGYTQADLGRLLGSRQRASDILAGKRPITMRMAWKLYHEWGIPAEALIAPPAARGRRSAA